MALPAFVASSPAIERSKQVRGEPTAADEPFDASSPHLLDLREPQAVRLDRASGLATGVAPFAMVLAAPRRPAADGDARLPASFEDPAVGAMRAVSSVALVYDRSNRILLGYHEDRGPRRSWSLAGGLVRRGERAAAAVLRELSEGLGIQAEVTGRAVDILDEQDRLELVFRCRRASGDWCLGPGVDGAAFFAVAHYALPANIDPDHRRVILARRPGPGRKQIRTHELAVRAA